MKRSYRPVGQGNFAVELFDEKTVVFDCGSKPVQNVFSQIDLVFQQDQIIDIVYLSHLDYDHCSGVDHLISRCDVKRIIIPYLDNQSRLLSKLTLFIENRDMSQLQFLDIVLSSERQSETISIFQKSIEITYIEVFDIESSLSISYMNKNGYPIISEWVKWIIIPFNFRNSHRSSQFQNEISKDPQLSSLTVDNLSQNWPLIKNKLIHIYQTKITGDINTNSMVVYSGPKSKNFHYNYRYSPGALFTGDYDTLSSSKRRELLNAINDYIPNIGYVTVPHHGSKLSNDALFIERFNSIFIIQSGKINQHNHPDYEVLLTLGYLHKHTLIINELSKPYDVSVFWI